MKRFWQNWRPWWMLAGGLALAPLLAGCVIVGSTIEARKQERPEAYAALTPEWRALVDTGQIKLGMNPDDVYIAWGAPSQITTGENESGQSTTWRYYGSVMREVTVWGWYRPYYEYYPVKYTRAQVVFTNGLVRQWQAFSPPPEY